MRVLTKLLGVGIQTTALKMAVMKENPMSGTIQGIETLNRLPAEITFKVGVNVCTFYAGHGSC